MKLVLSAILSAILAAFGIPYANGCGAAALLLAGKAIYDWLQPIRI